MRVNRQAGQRPTFAQSTLWTWAAVAANLFLAFVLSPVMIRSLGAEAYGMWALVFGLVEYYSLLDLGLRSAVVKYVAHHSALGDVVALNKTLNTAFAFLGFAAAVLALLTLVIAPWTPDAFSAPVETRRTFVHIVRIAGLTWSGALFFQCAVSCLEAIQRFDLSNRIAIAASVLRVALLLALVTLGFGLTALVTAVALVRLFQFAWVWHLFRREFPRFHWNRAAMDRATLHTLVRFGAHTIPSTIGWAVLTQGPLIAIGYALPLRFVGYYALPMRITLAALELVQRLGLITTARAAELIAHGRRDALVALGVRANRYALLVFLPGAVFLSVFGYAVFRLWLPEEYARASAPLLQIFLLSAVLGDAAHFSSGAMLYALVRHQLSAAALMAESIVAVALVYYFARSDGLTAAAVSSSLVMVANRGFFTPYLLCRELRVPFGQYLRAILVRPLSLAVGFAAILWALRESWLPGYRPADLLYVIAIYTPVVTFVSLRFGVLRADRGQFTDLIQPRWLATAARVVFRADMPAISARRSGG